MEQAILIVLLGDLLMTWDQTLKIKARKMPSMDFSNALVTEAEVVSSWGQVHKYEASGHPETETLSCLIHEWTELI